MRGHGNRNWYMVAGVVTMGLVAFGLIQGAPARDGNAAPQDRELIRKDAPPSSLQQSAQMPKELPTPEGPKVLQPHIWNPRDTPILGEKGVRWSRIVDATGVAGGDSGVAGSIPEDGACTCDEDCAAPSNQCQVVKCRRKCSVTLGPCNVSNPGPNPTDDDCPASETCLPATCVWEDAPVHTRCDLDGNFCTDDRCGSNATTMEIECQPTKISATSLVRLNRCSKECRFDPAVCTAAGNPFACCTGNGTGTCQGAGTNCDTFADCTTQDACMPKITNPGNYQTVCNELDNQCEVKVAGVGDPRGRCCTAGVCDSTWPTDAVCAGTWLRMIDPDDTKHACDASLGCPKYGSGIAPADVIGAANLDLGDVVPSPRRCAIQGNYCEVDADCWPVCVGGGSPGQSCDRDTDCPTGTCSVTTTTGCFTAAECPPTESCNPVGAATCPPRAGGSCADSADDCSETTGVFAALGDDYKLSNHPGFLRLKNLRFRGGVQNPGEVVVFDFYDTSFVRVDSFAQRFTHRGIFDYNLEIDCDPDCDLDQCPGLACIDPLEDPFIVPSEGYVVARTGRGISTQFGEDNSTFTWISTDVADTGMNDTTRMVMKPTVPSTGPLNFSADVTPGAEPNVLMFELLGEKVPAPFGACCNRSTGACADTLQWNCRKCTASGLACDLDRDCSVGQANDCSTRDWHGPRTRVDYIQGNGELCVDGLCAACACCTDTGCQTVANQAACDALGPPGANPPIQCGVGTRRCTLSPGTPCEDNLDCSGLGVCALSACTPDCCPVALTGYDCCRSEFVCTIGTATACQSNADCAAIGGDTCNFGAPKCLGAQSTCTTGALGEPCYANADCSGCSAGPKINQACNSNMACGSCVAGSNIGDACTVANQAVDCPGSTCTPGTCNIGGGICGPRDQTKVHVISVPPLSDPREADVYTISGSIPAAFGYVDDCTLGDDDYGWYELFQVDACAEVTVDLCCNQNPIRAPVSGVLESRCPCSVSKTIFPVSDEGGPKSGFGDLCNNEFCCEDGNFSAQFVVPAGRYHYQLSIGKNCSNNAQGCDNDAGCDPGAVCQRNPGAYQMHLTVRPCLTAACCCGTTCSVQTQTDCVASGCDWLGVTQINDQPIADCSIGTPCALGACCTANGCESNGTTGINKPTCDGLDGLYHGGLRCNTLRCPICPFEDQAHCQLSDTGQFIHAVDRGLGRRVADDFSPAGNSIGRVCWFPCFVGGSVDGPFECSGNPTGTPPPDKFVVRFYEDDTTVGAGGTPQGFPGVPVAGQPAVPAALGGGFGYAVTPDNKLPQTVGGTRCWRYSAPITPALAVTPNECYWMEIDGEGNEQQGGRCTVHWVDSGDGNNMRAVDADGVYEVSDIQTFDMAWCIDSGIVGASAPPVSQDGGCGDVPVACCRPGSCIQTNYTDCVGTASTPKFGVPFPYATCSPGLCPVPQNNDCSTAKNLNASGNACANQVSDADLGFCRDHPPPSGAVSINEVCSVSGQDCLFDPNPASCLNGEPCCVPRPGGTDAYRCLETGVDNRLATKEAATPNMQNTACSGSGQNSFQRDVWYTYTAPCTGRMTVSNCGELGWDSMLMVYSNGTSTCTCQPNNTQDLACNDDYCSTSATTSAVQANVVQGNCYLIRQGGWSQIGQDADAGAGITELDIGVLCNPPPTAFPPLAVTDPLDQLSCRKNRHICFRTNNPGIDVAFQITRAGAPALTGFAGPPDANGVSGVYPGPAVAANFRTNWPAILCVGDCEIAPLLTYDVRTVPGPAPGGTPTAPLAVSTQAMPGIKIFGDTTGGFNATIPNKWDCPNGVVNANDFQMALQKFLGVATAPHNTMSNVQAVSSIDQCLNSATNIADVFLIVKGFQGEKYPFYSCSTNGKACSTLGAACPTVPGDAAGVGTCQMPVPTTCPANIGGAGNCPL